MINSMMRDVPQFSITVSNYLQARFRHILELLCYLEMLANHFCSDCPLQTFEVLEVLLCNTALIWQVGVVLFIIMISDQLCWTIDNVHQVKILSGHFNLLHSCSFIRLWLYWFNSMSLRCYTEILLAVTTPQLVLLLMLHLLHSGPFMTQPVFVHTMVHHPHGLSAPMCPVHCSISPNEQFHICINVMKFNIFRWGPWSLSSYCVIFTVDRDMVFWVKTSGNLMKVWTPTPDSSKSDNVCTVENLLLTHCSH